MDFVVRKKTSANLSVANLVISVLYKKSRQIWLAKKTTSAIYITQINLRRFL